MPYASHGDPVAVADLMSLLANRTRAAFCLALMDGRAWTVSELASVAGVSAATASEHLTRLVTGGVLGQRRQGRHRYVQLASGEVAQLLEDVGVLAGATAARPIGLRAVRVSAALAAGRTCYDHLAGRLGVAVTDALGERGYLDPEAGCTLTPDGLTWLRRDLGFLPAPSRRPLARACLDWTERRSHLGGQAGAHLCRVLRERGWTVTPRGGRAVSLTAAGTTGLRQLLGVDVAEAV